MNELEFLDDRLCVTSAHSHDGVRHCAARLVSSGACCPDCGRFCHRRHSFTTRRLKDFSGIHQVFPSEHSSTEMVLRQLNMSTFHLYRAIGVGHFSFAENAPYGACVVHFNVGHECEGSRACHDRPRFSNQSRHAT